MSRYFIRNVKPLQVADAYGASMGAIIFRHLFWWADWTEVTVDADAAYANVLAINEPGTTPGNGFQVAAANPRIVYDPLGRFTLSMQTYEYLLFLKGTGQNRNVARIIRYIDANNVEIDADSAPPNGWNNEIDIAARVVGGNAGGTITFNVATGRLTAPKSILVQAPSGNLRARVYYQDTSNTKVYARPIGGAGTATEVGVGTTIIGGVDNIFRFHGVFDDPNFLVYATMDYVATSSFLVMWGELEGTDVADADPGFVYSVRDISGAYPWNYAFQMLNGNPTPVAINVYPCYIKRQFSTTQASANPNLFGFRLEGGTPGKAAIRKMRVVLDNVATYGACMRGKLPLVRQAYTAFENMRPMDAAGAWLNTYYGLIVPRNGPNDQLPII